VIHRAAAVHASTGIAGAIRVIIPAVAATATTAIATGAAAICSNIATGAILAIRAHVKMAAAAVRVAVQGVDLIVMIRTLAALGAMAAVGTRATALAVTAADVVCSNRTAMIPAAPEVAYRIRMMVVVCSSQKTFA
jgi:hypothetical protein